MYKKHISFMKLFAGKFFQWKKPGLPGLFLITPWHHANDNLFFLQKFSTNSSSMLFFTVAIKGANQQGRAPELVYRHEKSPPATDGGRARYWFSPTFPGLSRCAHRKSDSR
jgi:hypothetical protein